LALKSNRDRQQLNIRPDQKLLNQIDEKRIELRKTPGAIPGCSEVLRMALDKFLQKKNG